jgi:putative phage-type endonuclease
MQSVKQGTPEWLMQRAGKINASSCAAFEGAHKFSKAPDVVREAVRALAGADSEFKGNAATAHGVKTEPVAIKRFESLTGLVVEPTGSIEHPEYSFLRASPDGLIGLDACIEVKCPYSFKGPAKTYSIKDPAKTMYLWQIRMQLEVLDLEVCHFFCYINEDVWKHEHVVRGKYFNHEIQG